MALGKLITCDLCDDTITEGDSRVKLDNIAVRVGQRDWRDEDFHQFDICKACQVHKVAPLMAVFHAREQEIGMVH
jgi:hypothetical protein